MYLRRIGGWRRASARRRARLSGTVGTRRYGGPLMTYETDGRRECAGLALSTDMDRRSSLRTPRDPHLQQTTSAYRNIVSPLVSPKSFLFPHPAPKPSPASHGAPSPMDKAQQPSSFQQLEKVRSLLLGPAREDGGSDELTSAAFGVSFLSSSEKEPMLLYVPC